MTETANKDFNIGDPAPDFSVPSDNNGEISLSGMKGQKVILYFYPKDNTSGCTLEALAFEANLKKFQEAGYQVLGVSRDSIKSHCSFREKKNLSFPLLSDADEKLCNLYGVMKLKSMYGRQYMGIERSTFVIDENGKFVRILRNVKAKTHVDDLIKLLGI